jgi:hypothetical protein
MTMLYDPKWEQKTDPEFAGIRLSEFIAWLETKPADETYDYLKPTRCAAAQYLQSRGATEDASSVMFLHLDGSPNLQGDWLNKILHSSPHAETWTFGNALILAKQTQADLMAK